MGPTWPGSCTAYASRRLAAGCRVELRNPSEALGVGPEDATLSQVFTVYAAVRRHIPR